MKKLSVLAIAALLGAGASAQINGYAGPGYYDRGTAMYSIENYTGTVHQLQQASRSRQLTGAEQRRLEYCLAMSSLYKGQPARAYDMLRRWLAKWGGAPERTDVLMSCGDCLFTQGNYAEALKIYDDVDPRFLADRDRREMLQYRSGYACLRLALWDRARVHFGRLTGTSLADAARFYLAYISYANADYAAARQGFLECNPNTAPGNMADYYLSQIYYKEGDYSRALDTARALLRRGGDDPAFVAEANRIAGESLYQTGNPGQAIPYLQKYVAAVDKPALSSLYILGLGQYGEGEYEKAAATLRPVTADESSMGQNAYLYLGQALLQLGDTDGAIMAFDRALNMHHDEAARETAYYNYAVAKYAGGTVPFGSSVTTFEAFLKEFPDSRYADDVRQYVITGYLTDRNYEAALDAIRRVRNPNADVLKAKQQVLYTLGWRNLSAGNAAAAIPQLQEARSLSGYNARTDAETALALGEALLRDGKSDQAIPLLREYLDSRYSDNSAIARYDLGYAYMAEHEYDNAAQNFRAVLNSKAKLDDNTLADVWTRLGDCSYYNKDWTEAAADYDKAYKLNPSAGDYALFQQAVMQGYAGNFAAKLNGLRRLEREFPSSTLLPDALLEMTEAQLRTGDDAGAVDTWQRLIDNYPATAQGRTAMLQMAAWSADRGDTSTAIARYKNLIQSYPSSDEGAQAAEILKRLMAANGLMDDYVAFINSIDNAPRIDAGEAERLAFEAAEQQYLDGKGTALLSKYVQRYGENGAFSLLSYSYLMDAADEAGNSDRAYDYAGVIVRRWPDNAAAEQAYAIMGAHEYDSGQAELALQSWKQLERHASTPAMANEARMGIMRVARDLGRPDDLADAADAVLSSSTLGAEDKTEAAFSRGLAMKLKGDDRGAIAAWRDLAPLTDQLYGAKAAVYMAQTMLDNGDRKNARAAAEAFVNSGTPHAYWLARGFIVLADALSALDKPYEAREYLRALRENYPGNEADIFTMIDERLAKIAL